MILKEFKEMEIVKIDLEKEKKGDYLVEVISRLKKQQVLVLPTDTVYGLSCLAFSKKAVNRIYKIKKRPENKPFILLMKSFCMLRKYCYLSQRQYKYLKEAINEKEAITVILKSRDTVPNYLRKNDGSVAVRIPVGSKFLIEILKKVDEPIVSTSLNVSGEAEKKSVNNISNYFKKFKNKPDLVIDVGKLNSNKPSKIVDIRNVDDIKILRK